MIEVAYWNGIADLAVGDADRVGRVAHGKRRVVGRARLDSIIRERHRGVERTTVVSPGDVLLDQRIANGTNRRRRQVATTRQRTVRQVAGVGVVEHVVVVGLAVRLCRVGQIVQIAHDRPHTGLGEVGASAEVVVGGIRVVGARLRIRAGNVRRRCRRVAVAVAPERRIASAEHEVVGAGAAMERLVEVVAQGEAVSQHLQDRSFALLGIVEAH
jgi:hypothetical protein